jgi:hypothetical protein
LLCSKKREEEQKKKRKKYIHETRKMAGRSHKCKVFEMSLALFSKILHRQKIFILFDMIDLFGEAYSIDSLMNFESEIFICKVTNKSI